MAGRPRTSVSPRRKTSRTRTRKKPVSQAPHTFELPLRILGTNEGGTWIAHCLEMDLVAEAGTFKAASSALFDLIRMQVTFALQKDEPELIYHPAPPEYFVLFDRIHRERLQAFPEPPPDANYIATSFDTPRPLKRKYVEANA